MEFLQRSIGLWLDGGWTMVPLAVVAFMIYGAGVEIDLSGLGMPNVSGFVAWEHIDWKDTGAFETDSDVIRTGVRIKLNVLK